MEDNNNKPEKRIVDFFENHHVLTLSTSVDNIPYCAHCFYAYLEQENAFVFTSDIDTKHIQNILQNNTVAASVVLETKTVGKIQGVQMIGVVQKANDEEVSRAKKAYLKRFPYAVLMKTTLWVLKIDYIKMTDNRLGFGKKLIWQQNNC